MFLLLKFDPNLRVKAAPGAAHHLCPAVLHQPSLSECSRHHITPQHAPARRSASLATHSVIHARLTWGPVHKGGVSLAGASV